MSESHGAPGADTGAGGALEPVRPAVARQGGGPVRRLDPTGPPDPVVRRRNRRIILLVALPAVLVGAAALAASILADRSTPAAHPAFVPAGYKAVGDGVFSYAVPSSWSTNSAFSDDVGDLDTSGRSGWVGDHLGASPTAPGPAAAPPAVFESFGQNRPLPLTVGPATRIDIPGATVAYRYPVSRPDGFSGVAIDAWEQSSGAQLWLLVDADAATTRTVLSSLSG